MVAVCDMSFSALVLLASGDMSCASGSYSASMETAVRSTAMGDAPLGTPFRKASTGAGMARLATNPALQLIQLRPLGQAPGPEQKNHFLERGVFAQRANIIALIAEDARIPVDKANPRLRGNNAF